MINFLVNCVNFRDGERKKRYREERKRMRLGELLHSMAGCCVLIIIKNMLSCRSYSSIMHEDNMTSNKVNKHKLHLLLNFVVEKSIYFFLFSFSVDW